PPRSGRRRGGCPPVPATAPRVRTAYGFPTAPRSGRPSPCQPPPCQPPRAGRPRVGAPLRPAPPLRLHTPVAPPPTAPAARAAARVRYGYHRGGTPGPGQVPGPRGLSVGDGPRLTTRGGGCRRCPRT